MDTMYFSELERDLQQLKDVCRSISHIMNVKQKTYEILEQYNDDDEIEDRQDLRCQVGELVKIAGCLDNAIENLAYFSYL